MPENTALAASSLCGECGLCCTGELFSHVSVLAEEAEHAREAGLNLEERSDGKFKLFLPCPCFSDGACTIYDSRPAKCRDFYCILQTSVLNGSIPADEASSIVGTVKRNSKWLSENSIPKHGEKKSKINLRNFLYSFQRKIFAISKDRKLTASEHAYIKKAFEQAMLIDRYFKKTRLLTIYARLIQALEVGSRYPMVDHNDQNSDII